MALRAWFFSNAQHFLLVLTLGSSCVPGFGTGIFLGCTCTGVYRSLKMLSTSTALTFSELMYLLDASPNSSARDGEFWQPRTSTHSDIGICITDK